MSNTWNSARLNALVETDLPLLLLRVVSAGSLIYFHGWAKIIKVINGNMQFLDPIGIGPEASLILAAFAEGICALFVILGFYTRLTSLFLVINFIVAFLVGYKEPALLYLVIFTTIFLIGPGRWAVDSE